MTSQNKSIARIAAELASNPKIESKVQNEINNSKMVSALLEMRVAKKITQEKVAESMGCDPSKISRLEAGNDSDLKLRDVVGYVKALNMEMSVVFDDPAMAAATKIKMYVFRIRDDLEKLVSIAKRVGGDDEIAKKIHQFYGEVLFNFLRQFDQSYQKLLPVVRSSSSSQDSDQSQEESDSLKLENKATDPNPVSA